MANDGVILGFPFIMETWMNQGGKEKQGKNKLIAAHLHANNWICFLST